MPKQVQVLGEIIQIGNAQQVDVVIIGGFLFNAFNSPVSAFDFFYKTLKHQTDHGKRVAVAIAGKHDLADIIVATEPLTRQCRIFFWVSCLHILPKEN